uniref:Uncharacterized protein n=1 Tax=Anguilla anguilla TaxID=7936 RepID=A0A0E9RMM1_ANGAN
MGLQTKSRPTSESSLSLKSHWRSGVWCSMPYMVTRSLNKH